MEREGISKRAYRGAQREFTIPVLCIFSVTAYLLIRKSSEREKKTLLSVEKKAPEKRD